MKRTLKTIVSRGVAAVFLAALMLSLSLGATAGTTIEVGDETELLQALSNAAGDTADYTILYRSGVTSITLSSSSSVYIPSNATIDLSASGGTLRMENGTVTLNGTINGGTVEVAGSILAVNGFLTGGIVTVSKGTLVRMNGCNITSAVSAPSSGTGEIRYQTVLSLENLGSSSTETIQTVIYSGIAEADDDATFVKDHLATGYVYPLYGETITKVTTDAGNVFRLGTKYTDVLSLAFAITYYGTTDATLSIANPTSYTASDSAIQLNNPTKDGYMFDGWTCDQLSITIPTTNAVIPEGMTGALSFVANWTEQTMPSGGSKTSGGGTTGSASTATTDTEEETESEEPAVVEATDETTATSNVRIGQGTSSTRVTFTSDVDEVMPTLETVGGNSFPWGWTLLGVGGSAILVYVIALINRKIRERADIKK